MKPNEKHGSPPVTKIPVEQEKEKKDFGITEADVNTVHPTRQKKRSLKSLQEAALPRLDWRELFQLKGEPLSAEDVKVMDAYFSQFLKPQKETACVGCGARQSGGDNILKQWLDSHFTWGLANGEGFCDRCKYPARAYHRKVGPIQFLNMILQYHPDELTDRAKKRDLSDVATNAA